MVEIVLFSDDNGWNKRMRLIKDSRFLATEYITGPFVSIRYWFKPIERRIEIATNRLTDIYNSGCYKEYDISAISKTIKVIE